MTYQQARVERIDEILSTMTGVLGTKGRALAWMRTPRDVFDDLTAFEIIAVLDEEGIRRVADEVGRINGGVY